MNDFEVRTTVHKKILHKYHEDPHSLVIDEFSINLGAGRADIAVVNGLIHGYELKSFKDNLNRLPKQVEIYSAVMDKVTLIVDEHHCMEALLLIPEWWGVKIIAKGGRGTIKIKNHRKAKVNKSVNPLYLARLLWKDECIDLLKKFGLTKGVKSKPRFELWDLLAEIAPLRTLQSEVRQYLKSRKSWRNQG